MSSDVVDDVGFRFDLIEQSILVKHVYDSHVLFYFYESADHVDADDDDDVWENTDDSWADDDGYVGENDDVFDASDGDEDDSDASDDFV